MKIKVIKISDDLKNLRLSLDNINNSIADLISQRIDIVKRVGKIKKQKIKNLRKNLKQQKMRIKILEKIQ